MLKRIVVGGLTACSIALPAAAQDAYLVGITAALTGPPSSTYAPAVDALRIYIGRVKDGHGARRSGSHPAADCGLHALRHEAQGCRPELGLLVGAMGNAGAHPGSAAQARLAGRLYCMGSSRGRSRTCATEGWKILRRQFKCLVPG